MAIAGGTGRPEDDTYVRHMIDFIDEADCDENPSDCYICIEMALGGDRVGHYVPGGAYRWTPQLPELWPDNGYSDYFDPDSDGRPPHHWVEEWGSFFHEIPA